MSINTGFSFNRNEECIILSPDFLSLAKIEIDSPNFIGSGYFVDSQGKLATLTDTVKFTGLVTEANYYNAAGGKVLKPSGNVVAYFGGVRFVTKVFTDNADAPIKAGDVLTIVNGKPQKLDDTHKVPVLEVVNRGTDYIECITFN
jgi:hypothetical protein